MQISGLNFDVLEALGKGWSGARNIVLSKKLNSISNEDGWTKEFDHPNNYRNIGVIPLPKGRVLFYTNGTKGQIWCDFGTGTPQLVIKDNPGFNVFNFNLNCPIEGTYKYNWKRDLIIAFWDGVTSDSNNPRILNLSNIPFPLTGSLEFTSITQGNLIKMFPDYKHPNYFVYGSTIGGNIPTGTYALAVQYEVGEDDGLNWSLPSHPFPIGKQVNNHYKTASSNRANVWDVSDSYQVSGADENSGLSIRYNVSNIDTRFTHMKIAAIRNVNGTRTAVIIDRFLITGASMDLVWSGNFKEEIDINEILIDSTVYEKIKTGTFNSDRLTIGNMKTMEQLKYQKWANKITVSYVISDIEDLAVAQEVPIEIYQTPYKRYQYFANPGQSVRVKTPKPGEVYAMYIHLVYKNGYISDGFHIPGRPKSTILIGATTFNEDETITNAVAAEPTQFGTDEALLGTNYGAKLFHTRDTASIAHPVIGNKCGYWENQDELYPNLPDYDGTTDYDGNPITGGIDIRGQKVRHHRMPDVRTLNGGGTFNNLTKFIRIQVHNVDIPADIHDQIEGVMISYGEKTYENSVILGMTPIHRDQFQGNAGDTHITSGGAKVPSNNISKLYARVYDTQLQHLKPNINPAFVKEHYVSTSPCIDLNVGTPTAAEQHKTGFTPIAPLAGISTTTRYRVIKNVEYLPENNSATVPISNNDKEEFMRLTFELDNTNCLRNEAFKVGEVAGVEGDSLNYGGSLAGLNNLACVIHYFGVVTIESIIKNVHTNFYDQKLAMASRFVNSVSVGVNNNIGSASWDTFITGYSIKRGFYTNLPISHYACSNSFHLPLSTELGLGSWEQFDKTDIYNNVLAINYRFPCYSNYNYLFNRKTDYKQVLSIKMTPCSKDYLGFNVPFKHTTDIDYDIAYSGIRNLKMPDSYSPYKEFINEHPFRVHRAIVTQSEEKTESWRRFVPNDYHDMPKNKGVIWKLSSFGNALMIHHEYTLFVAMLKDKLTTSVQEVYLGQGDLFDRKPTDILEDNIGYAGCKSQWGAIVCKHGYVSIDKEQGKVFIYNGSLDEISNDFVRNWFKDNFKLFETDDNPFYKRGFYCVFDDDFNRLIIGRIDGDWDGSNFTRNSDCFTISYSFDFKCWTALHDYKPNFMYADRDHLYAIDNIAVDSYLCNVKTVKGKYIGNTVYPSYFDWIFNREDYMTNNLTSTSWITDVIHPTSLARYEEKTITDIMVYNHNQCTGVVHLDNHNLFFGNNNRGTVGHWNFNKMRDCVIDRNQPIINKYKELATANISANKSFFKKGYFLGKFIAIRYIYDNVDQYDIHFHNAIINGNLTNR